MLVGGVEPPCPFRTADFESTAYTSFTTLALMQVARIELTFPTWKAGARPIYQTCFTNSLYQLYMKFLPLKLTWRLELPSPRYKGGASP